MTAYSERVGEYIRSSIASGAYSAYVPKPLPPISSIEMEKIYPLLDQANIALGRLDGLSIILPDPSLYLYMYTRKEAVSTAQAILNLFTEDRKKIETIGKSSASTLMVYHYLQRHPTIDSNKIVENCHLSLPTAIKSINHLIRLSIVTEITGKARNKIYVYYKYLDILSVGTTPI